MLFELLSDLNRLMWLQSDHRRTNGYVLSFSIFHILSMFVSCFGVVVFSPLLDPRLTYRSLAFFFIVFRNAGNAFDDAALSRRGCYA